METLVRHLSIVLVFLTVGAFAWLYGGTRSDLFVPTIPWLWAFLMEALLFFPQRRPYEDGVAARQRLWKGLGRDPLLYVTFVLAVILVIPLTNRGLCAVCDYPAIMAGADPKPLIPFAPFCVDVRAHFGVLLWFLPSLTAMLAARHALLPSGKRMLMEMIVWNAVALAVLGFIQQAALAPAPFWIDDGIRSHFFSVFGYPNMAGAFFAAAFAFAVGLWLTRVSEVAKLPPIDRTKSLKPQKTNRWLRAHYPLAAAVLLFFAVLCSLCRSAMIATLVLSLIAFLYFECALIFSRRNRAVNFKKAVAGIVGGAVFVFGVNIFAPADWTRELGTVDSIEMLDRVSGKAQYHARVALDIVKDYPLFGVGGWGYKHFCNGYLTEDEAKGGIQNSGGANVHNDYLQFMCEHGILGFACLVALFGLLVYPLFREWFARYRAARFLKRENAPPAPRVIYCIPAGVFWILLGNTVLLVCATGDCPFRAASVMSMFFVSLACADGYFERESR